METDVCYKGCDSTRPNFFQRTLSTSLIPGYGRFGRPSSFEKFRKSHEPELIKAGRKDPEVGGYITNFCT